MRLFQLIDGDSGDNMALYHIERETLTDLQAADLIQENYGHDNADEILEECGIIRVFVTEVFI